MNSPLEQFDIIKLYSKIIFNTTLQLCVLSCFLILIFTNTIIYNKIIYNKIIYIQYIIISFVSDIFNQNVSSKNLNKYFLYFLTMFITIVLLNLIGMIPYSFTITSHLSITLTLALISFIAFNLIGIYKNGLHMLNLFLPSGIPISLVPFLILIEVISYVARVISLSVRLFANMMAGHTLLKILGGFAFSLIISFGLFSVLGFIVIIVILIIIGLELVIAILQAYVFLTLSIIYFNDAVNISH